MKIIHVFRAPVGGLFRHVMDLASKQLEAGHQIGIIADSTTGTERTQARLDAIEPKLALGVHRMPMHRNPTGSDILTQLRINRIVAGTGADIVHGHGSKGGLYARLPGLAGSTRLCGPLRVYTPHGGSLNYHPDTTIHKIYMHVERLLEKGTDLLLFESQFVADRYHQYVCQSQKPTQVFFNGLMKHELEPVVHRSDAADFMFIGELRPVKGVDIVLTALDSLRTELGRTPTLDIFGTGPDEDKLRRMATELGLGEAVRFRGNAPARSAFESGRTMVLGSTFESMPYVVLEAAGCAQPLIATNVGGIPEIFGEHAGALVPAGDASALKLAMRDALVDPESLRVRADQLQKRVAEGFSVERMASTIDAAYQRALAARRPDLIAA